MLSGWWCAENKLPSCYIRPMVFYGAEAMGLHRERPDG